jgi:hypothetical protein
MFYDCLHQIDINIGQVSKVEHERHIAPIKWWKRIWKNFWRRFKSERENVLEILPTLSENEIVDVTTEGLGVMLPAHKRFQEGSTPSEIGSANAAVLNNATAEVHCSPILSLAKVGLSSTADQYNRFGIKVSTNSALNNSLDPANPKDVLHSNNSPTSIQDQEYSSTPKRSPAHASAVSGSIARQPPSARRSRAAATPFSDETQNSLKSGFLGRSRVKTMWREYVPQSSLDDEQVSGQLHELMVLDTLPDKHPSLHMDETEAARPSGHQEGTVLENVVDDRKKVSVRVLPQHRPENEAVLGAATDTAVGPSKRLGGVPAAKLSISERSRNAELLASVSYIAMLSQKQISGVSDRTKISPMRSAVQTSSSVNALAKSRGLPKESASGSAEGKIARDGGLEKLSSRGSSGISKFGALHDTLLREIVVEIDARDVKQHSAPNSKSALASAKLPNSPNSVDAIEELSDAFGAPPPFDADDLKLVKRREEKAAARDTQRRGAAASSPLGDVHPHRTSSSAVDAFGAPPPFDADDLKLAKRREAKTAARSAHGPVEEQRVSGAPGISSTATPSLGGSERRKPAANPIPPFPVSASLQIEEGSAQLMSQRGASLTSGIGKAGVGSGRVEIENRAERKKQGWNYGHA